MWNISCLLHRGRRSLIVPSPTIFSPVLWLNAYPPQGHEFEAVVLLSCQTAFCPSGVPRKPQVYQHVLRIAALVYLPPDEAHSRVFAANR